MDIAGAVVGSLLVSAVLYTFADILVRAPGYLIYCALFTTAEYDPDHQREVDVSSVRVAATGTIFWLLLVGGAYGVYRIAM